MPELSDFSVNRQRLFKQWIQKRFIDDVDINAMHPHDLILWSNALIELGVYIRAKAASR